VAGLLAGPALPADVATQTGQPAAGWVLRLAIFVLVAVLVAWLVRDRRESLGAAVNDSLVSGRLVRGLGRGELEVWYQPILDFDTGRVVAVEALSRWRDPKRGWQRPDEFIPQAERTGAIAVQDRHVLRVAAHQARSWSDQLAPVLVSVNVSATRFAENDLATDVAEVLAESGLDPGSLQLEITESAIIADIGAAIEQIAELRRLGVRVGVDDFGAGQSSLAYLNRFEVDTVKIDRGLVSQLPAQPRAERLLAGIISMFRTMQLTIVAEGIETAEQYVHLQEAGCQHAQGFFIGRPAPAPEITSLLMHGARSAHRADAGPPRGR
jgi:EAL domain-containing protein (putative c-di-GMP-specific phosphodiesterase class I)